MDRPDQHGEPGTSPGPGRRACGPPQPGRHCRHPQTQQPSPNPAPGEAGETAHQSLQLTPPPFHPDRARPRAIIYIHLSEEAITAGTGVARVEDVGPVLLTGYSSLLGDHCSISLKPVIDLPAGHTRSTAMRFRPGS